MAERGSIRLTRRSYSFSRGAPRRCCAGRKARILRSVKTHSAGSICGNRRLGRLCYSAMTGGPKSPLVALSGTLHPQVQV